MEIDLATMAVEDEQKSQAMFRARWKQGYKTGIRTTREKANKILQSYFDLTQEPNEDGSYNDNTEWDAGFQAAMALIRDDYNWER